MITLARAGNAFVNNAEAGSIYVDTEAGLLSSQGNNVKYLQPNLNPSQLSGVSGTIH